MPHSSVLDGELNGDMVLRQEVHAIWGIDLKDANGNELKGDALYRRLNDLNGTALCLSGGGIRSATFALGVIEALATHPRQASKADEGERPCASARASLLRQFNYLSTVSGGGYIGSWLSAWIARAGYDSVWPRLIGRRDHPDQEPGETSWLRAYSNYLTPRLGLFSADTWTAVALYVRNLILNWLVILPAVVLLLLAIKAFTVLSYAAAAGLYVTFGRLAVVGFVLVGVTLLIVALRFALLNRPSAFARPETEERPRGEAPPRGKDAHRDEAARVGAGGDTRAFIKRCLLPALAAALLLSLYLVIRGPKLTSWSLAALVFISLLVGALIYAASWFVAWPPGNDHALAKRERLYWLRDFTSWIVAGGVYGALIGAGVYILAHYDLWFVIGYINWPSATGAGDQPSITSATGYFLIALIYGVPWIITAQLSAEMIFVGLTNWQPRSDADREWFGRSTGYFTVVALMWLVGMFLVLIAGELALAFLAKGEWAKYLSTIVAAASGLFSTVIGKSGKSSPTEEKDKSGLLMRLAPPFAAVVFLTILVLAINCLIDYLLFDVGIVYSSLLGAASPEKIPGDVFWLALGFVITAFVAGIAWAYVNINRFSIHALYRNRLIRGYLGASNPDRRPNPFTGFDSSDNIRLPQLWPPRPGEWQPFHVVNIALNIVNSKRLAWQERKAESFTATPLHCGTAGLGYRPSDEYGDKERGGMSLGTALAISGAAASPSMGYHSSPIVSLMLALFNVRLGWWLGNPGSKGAPHYYQSDGPKVAIFPFIAEMFGLTTDDRHYVYLSDGGHFENLGLYEMIRRRCRCIIVSDAGCDPRFGFEDLGNAVRKIAIDLGVEVRFGKLHELRARSRDGSVIKGAYYAIGEIDYKTAPEWKSGAEASGAGARNGAILYIKPGYHGTESAGVVAYATANAAFPHETTADQFFSESQFESYRTLGFEIMDGVLKDAAENVDTIADAGILTPAPVRGNLCDLIRALDTELLRKAEVALKPPPTKLANIVSALDADVIAELRTALRRDNPLDTA